ncbi:hydrogenase maturation protein [Streptomyces sp. NPDC051993]|uniref:hydrogenase maturation protein n=1 Tax=unclassified Streptomyces TaxID=2593676 RepID=UPI0034183BBF
MHILLIASAFNSLAQRAHAELREHGHTVAVEIARDDESLRAAVRHHEPDLLVAPMLKSAIPEDVWSAHTCLIVHPGPIGDRGPSSLDWAIHEQAGRWGATVLQADAEMDAGDVWATETFAVTPVGKSDLYRNEVADAAMTALLSATERFASGTYRPRAQRDIPEARRPHVRPYFSQEHRRIHWDRDTTETVLRALRAADSQPGVLDELLGAQWFLHGGHPEHELRGRPGELLATRAEAVCRATVDGAVWLPELRPRRSPGGPATFKLPAVTALGGLVPGLPEHPAPGYPRVADGTWSDIRYREEGGAGFLSFSFPGGAMSTSRCRRLLDAYRAACSRPTSVLVLGGNRDFFSNGIHLNVIEAAADPGGESWANIVAMDDLVEAVLSTTDRLVVSAVGGNAAAGGVLLALAADEVWCRTGGVLNPHYRLMGLYGSEYWTYTLPRRVGPETAERLMGEAWPVGAAAGQRMGLVDRLVPCGPHGFGAAVTQMAVRLASSPSVKGRIAAKKAERERQEAMKPLAAYRQEELAHMRRTFFDPDAFYHTLRGAFVRKARPDGTPAHLAGARPGRRVIVGGPVTGGVAEVSAACCQRESVCPTPPPGRARLRFGTSRGS